MKFLWAVAAAIVSFCIILVRWSNRHWSHLPGPSLWLRIPLVGHGHLLTRPDPVTALLRMKRSYGDVFRLDMLGNTLPAVVVCSFKAVQVFQCTQQSVITLHLERII